MSIVELQLKQRTDSAANWTSSDPILAEGELGFENDSGKFKVGNGVSTWSTLTYFGTADNNCPTFQDCIDIQQDDDTNLDQTLWKIEAATDGMNWKLVDDARVNEVTWARIERSGTGASMVVDSITWATGAGVTALTLGSTQNATFANAVVLAETKRLYLDGGVDTYIDSNAANQMRLITGGVSALTINASQDATFAGNVDIDGTSLSLGTTASGIFNLHGGATTSPQIRFFDGGVGRARIGVSTGTTGLSLSGSDTLTSDLFIDSAGDATFAGSVTAEDRVYIDSAVTGNPAIEFHQDAVQKAFLQYVDAGDTFYITADGEILIQSANVTAITLATNQDATFSSALTVQGAFTSLGIDDNATSERQNLSDNSVGFGSTTAASQFSITRRENTGLLDISGGSGSGAGGNILLYGGAHASTAGDLYLRSGANIFSVWDESAGSWDVRTGVGAKTLALTINASQNATFAGDILVDNAAPIIDLTADLANIAQIRLAGNANTLGSTSFDIQQDSVGDAYLWLRSANTMSIGTSGAAAITIAADGTSTFANGISLGSRVGATTSDVSEHIALFGLSYGLGITSGQMNFVTNSSLSMSLDASNNLAVLGEVSGSALYPGTTKDVYFQRGNTNYIDLKNDGGAGTVAGLRFYDQGVLGGFIRGSNTAIQIFNTSSQLALQTSGANTFLYSAGVAKFNTSSTGTTTTGTAYITDGVRLLEQADHATTPTATFGELWLKSGATQALMFTDDAGTDYDLTAGGGGGSPGGSNEQLQYNNGGVFGGIAEFTYDDTSPTTNNMFDIAVAASLTSGNVLSIFNSGAGKTGSLVNIGSGNATATVVPLLVSTNGLGNAFEATSSNVAAEAAVFSSATASRTQPVVQILNDNATGTGDALEIQQDQGGWALNITGGANGLGIRLGQGGILFDERPDHANTPAAGFGELWCGNAVPNVIMWTDDTGLDFQLNRQHETAVATTSGASVTVATGLTAPGVNEIIVTLKGVSTTAANAFVSLKVGSGGTVVTTGYTSSVFRSLSTTTSSSGSTTQFYITDNNLNAAETVSGTITFTRHDRTTNTWMMQGALVCSTSGEIFLSAGTIDLTNTNLQIIEIHTSSGTFDAGEVAINYRG